MSDIRETKKKIKFQIFTNKFSSNACVITVYQFYTDIF
jgi:hypothetical protein